MPQSTAYTTRSPSGHFPTLAAQQCRSLSQHFARRRCLLRLKAAVSTALTCLHVDESVHVGQTPYGRGLLSRTDQPSGKHLLSVPFSQLLLLPDNVHPSFEKTRQRFLRDHGELPAELLRFIQGDSADRTPASCRGDALDVGQDDLTGVVV